MFWGYGRQKCSEGIPKKSFGGGGAIDFKYTI